MWVWLGIHVPTVSCVYRIFTVWDLRHWCLWLLVLGDLERELVISLLCCLLFSLLEALTWECQTLPLPRWSPSHTATTGGTLEFHRNLVEKSSIGVTLTVHNAIWLYILLPKTVIKGSAWSDINWVNPDLIQRLLGYPENVNLDETHWVEPICDVITHARSWAVPCFDDKYVNVSLCEYICKIKSAQLEILDRGVFYLFSLRIAGSMIHWRFSEKGWSHFREWSQAVAFDISMPDWPPMI